MLKLSNSEIEARLKQLTERQYKVLTLRCEGKTNEEIANQEGWSDATIRADMSKIYSLLGMNNLGQKQQHTILLVQVCPILLGKEPTTPSPAPTEAKDHGPTPQEEPTKETSKEPAQPLAPAPIAPPRRPRLQVSWLLVGLLGLIVLFLLLNALRSGETPATITLPTTPLPSPVPTARIALPFVDNFDNGIAEAWIRYSGDYRVANARLVNSDSRGIVWLGEADWRDVVVEANVDSCNCMARLVEILVRMQDPQNYVAVRLQGIESFEGDRVNEGIYVVRNGAPVKKILGIGRRLGPTRIEVIGDTYRVFAAGELIGTVTDDTFNSGGVGIQLSNAVSIDDFSVRADTP